MYLDELIVFVRYEQALSPKGPMFFWVSDKNYKFVTQRPSVSKVALPPDKSLVEYQGCNRKIFLMGQSQFSWFFFPGMKCFFPVENFHFGRPKKKKQILVVLKSEKQKKKKNLPFSIFHLPFYNFPSFLLNFHPFFPFFPCLFFPSRSAEISRSEVSGGHSAPLPPAPQPVTPLLNMLRRTTLPANQTCPLIGFKMWWLYI